MAAWWRFVGFSDPGPLRGSRFAIVGLTFEAHTLAEVPLTTVEDTVRVSYADQVLPLTIRYSNSRFAAPVLRARAGAIAESALLVLFCVAVIPILAGLLALDAFVVSDRSVAAAWAAAVLILGGGYGTLAVILASTGRRVPYPRRAVLRTRAAVAELRSLGQGRP